VKIKIFGRNIRGNSLHPRTWTYLTGADKNFLWHGRWDEAYEKAEQIHDALIQGKFQTEDSISYYDKVMKTIYWYRRSIKLQAHHPKAAMAEFNIGSLYLKLYEFKKDILLKDEAFKYLNRTIQFYPGSSQESLAKEILKGELNH